MQARAEGRPTDFFTDGAMERKDASSDQLFYGRPRLVSHIDARANAVVSNLYGELLRPGMAVLDLMGSWDSHLPKALCFKRVTGLGLNAEELKSNPSLSDYVIQDLNANPVLPFDDGEYDAAVCTVSIEYLIDPFRVFREVHRILRPGGYFIVTFSNRWFPPKVVRVWQEIHEFERIGLVLEYFLAPGLFEDLNTFSMRGLPRPEEDKYYGPQLVSDPVYAVWGRTQGS
jgi:SAM-dependent methyltransferase